MSYPWGERQNVKPEFDTTILPVSTVFGEKKIQFVLVVKTPGEKPRRVWGLGLFTYKSQLGGFWSVTVSQPTVLDYGQFL